MSARIPAVVLAAVLLIAPAPARAQSEPAITAPSGIVVEASTGDIAYAKEASQRRPIASTTKLMTALISLDTLALDDVLTAPAYSPVPGESLVGLKAGERMTVKDLMRALLLPSANDAAVTLATGVSGSVPAFVKEMNDRARALGLRDTNYTNPVGLDVGDNRSSARDLVRLAIRLRGNGFFRDTVDMPRATLTSGARRRVVTNRNTLVRDVGYVNGVKTGHTTDAGYVLVGSATRDGVTVVSAVLGDPSEAARDADSLALLKYGLSRYRLATIVGRDTVLGRAKLAYRDQRVELIAADSVRRVLRRGQKADVRVVGVPDEISGPLPAGSEVGTVEVKVGDRTVARTPLVTATAVPKASLGDRLGDVLSRPGSILLLLVLLACTVSLVLLRRRVVRRAGSRT